MATMTVSRSRSRSRLDRGPSSGGATTTTTTTRSGNSCDVESAISSSEEERAETTAASSPDSQLADEQNHQSSKSKIGRASGRKESYSRMNGEAGPSKSLHNLQPREDGKSSGSRSRSRGRPPQQQHHHHHHQQQEEEEDTDTIKPIGQSTRSDSKMSITSLRLGEPLVNVAQMARGGRGAEKNKIRAGYLPLAEELDLPKGLPPLPKSDPPTDIDERDQKTPDVWLPRDPRLVRLTGRHPFNVEPPLPELWKSGFITPIELWYVRNHGYVPRVEDSDCDSWELSIDGLVDRPMKITLGELKAHPALPVLTLPVTMVCAGNRRKEQNVHQKSLGFSWGAAGLSTALFTGVMLADVMHMVGIQRGGMHVIFEGIDELPNGKYGTSLRRRWCLDDEMGLMLAWGMNGEGLRPDHGKPLRLVVPGHIGGRSVKWLNKIIVSDQESQHHLHFFDNRVLPTTVGPDEAREVKNWWYDPRYMINELNVQSAIVHPAHDETIDLVTTEPYEIQGYAFSGGGRRVTRVEVSIDQGRTWLLTDTTYPEDMYRVPNNVMRNHPYLGTLDLTMTGQCFCWCLWHLTVPREKLKTTGVICVRAMDESMNVQPYDMYWNPTGMMNNWWFRVALNHNQELSSAQAEHPTMPGTQAGGWMQRLKDEGQDVRFPRFKMPGESEDDPEPIKKKVDAAAKKEVSMIKPDVTRKITMAEVEEHNAEHDCWFVVKGNVYDGVPFMKDHPGGADSIILVAGADASEDFMTIHSSDAKRQLAEFHIGILDNGAGGSSKPESADNISETEVSKIFLSKNQWKKAKLVERIILSPDARIFRFALDSPEQELGLPCGQHVFTRLTRKHRDRVGKPIVEKGTQEVVPANAHDGEVVQRAYTPVSRSNAKGFIDMLIKVYFGTHQHPPGGKMSMGFEELEIGDSIEFKGPMGSFIYLGRGVAQWKNQKLRLDQVGFIAGGSGITPIIAALRGIMEDESEEAKRVRCKLITANRSEVDILCRDDLEEMKANRPDQLSIWYILSNAPASWKYSVGYATAEIISTHLPPAPSKVIGGVPEVPAPSTQGGQEDSLPFKSIVLLCGPPAMIKGCTAELTSCGWNAETDIVIF